MNVNAVNNVARGVQLLDKHRPGWETKIDLYILNLGTPDRCILGQLYGRFTEGLQAFKDAGDPIDFMEPYGFCPLIDDDVATTNEWKRVITERLQPVAA
jgi:hypothetical protein